MKVNFKMAQLGRFLILWKKLKNVFVEVLGNIEKNQVLSFKWYK